ncbi:MAG TPA: hypothetical protein DEH78_01780 [Solibacterales bacterium]|nr:hypothetical protein [Bryobacterales bacterium]
MYEQELADKILERIKSHGFGWYTRADIPAGAPSGRSSGALIKAAMKIVGRPVEVLRPEQAEKLVHAASMLRSGVAENEVQSEIERAYSPLIGLQMTVARRLAGVESATVNTSGDAKVPAVLNDSFRDAINFIGHAEKIRKQIVEIDHKVEALKIDRANLERELEVYKPAMAALANLQTAVARTVAASKEVAR